MIKMNRLKIPLLMICMMSMLVSCKDKKVKSEPAGQQNEVKEDHGKDSTDIRQTILSFYNWYTKNYEQLGKYKLYQGEKPPYKMDWSEVDKMHKYISDSVPQLGQAFLSNQRKFLQQADSAFKVDVQDEIPYGFDYDWYTNSQEDPQYLLDELNKSSNWIYTINGNNAMVDIKNKWMDNGKETESTLIRIDMAKENGTWKISNIRGVDL
jgi:hypothetical protein